MVTTPHHRQLVSTKFLAPRLGATFSARPRLLARLQEGLTRPLTVVCAGAGYGKTTAVCAWREAALAQGEAIGWLSLEETDNDPSRFWTYFLATLAAVAPEAAGISAELQGAFELQDAEALLTAFINEFNTARRDVCLVCDDFHVITNPAIHRQLGFLIDHLPAALHLYLTTRTPPPLPLARLRARDQLVELGPADLRMTLEETGDFLAGRLSVPVPPAQVEALAERTEGWTAALLLVALHLRERIADPAAVAAVGGGTRELRDFFVQEIFNTLPEDVRQFLLRTSVLHLLEPEACNALAEREDSRRVLCWLEEINLFTQSLDAGRIWFRYHHLFRDFLQQRLREEDPALLEDAHRRAFRWHEETGDLAEALAHAREAGLWEEGCRLLDREADDLLMSGEVPLLRAWCDSAPPEVLHAHPALYLTLGLVNLFSYRFTVEMERYLPGLLPIEQAITGAMECDPAAGRELLGLLETIRAAEARIHQQIPRSLELMEQARAHLPARRPLWRCANALNLAAAYRLRGELHASIEVYREQIPECRATGNLRGEVTARSELGEILLFDGALRESERVYQEALRITTDASGRLLPMASDALYGLGLAAYERGELDCAEELLREGLALATRWQGEAGQVAFDLMLAHVARARGQADEAAGWVAQAEGIISSLNAAVINALFAPSRMRLALQTGKIAAARQWADAEGLRSDAPIEPRRTEEMVLLVRLLLAEGRVEESLGLLERLAPHTRQPGWRLFELERLFLLACAHRERAETDAAVTAFARLLASAEPEGYYRLILDEGRPAQELLAMVANARDRLPDGVHISPAYLCRLRAGFGEAPVSEPAPEPAPDALTARELEILRLIAAGRTNQQIADALCVALSTVKTHINNLFTKLDAANRTHALAEARRRGLL
ncbi:MAG: LuxR C-terminal-related transcriptional regulator [Armatimonadota bacterium]